MIYELIKEKLDKIFARICTDEKKKIKKKKDSLAWKVTTRSQERDLDYILLNNDDLLEGFAKSEEDTELLSPNDQKRRFQLSDLKKQLIYNTKPLFCIYINFSNTISKKVDLD